MKENIVLKVVAFMIISLGRWLVFKIKVNGQVYASSDFFIAIRTLEQKGWILGSPGGSLEFVLIGNDSKKYGTLYFCSVPEGDFKDISELPENVPSPR